MNFNLIEGLGFFLFHTQFFPAFFGHLAGFFYFSFEYSSEESVNKSSWFLFFLYIARTFCTYHKLKFLLNEKRGVFNTSFFIYLNNSTLFTLC